MSWEGGGRRGYHHGNLREALIRAALDLIAQKGPAGFTFADAARAAGVSSAAPYRHYRDCEALLVDSATQPAEFSADSLADETIWLIATPAATALVSVDALEADVVPVATAGSTFGSAAEFGDATTSKLANGATSGAGGLVLRKLITSKASVADSEP